MSVDVSELRALADQFGAVPARFQPQAVRVIQRGGFGTVIDAQVGAPVDTGLLASSIGVDFDGDGLGFTAGPTANYGAHVEYGTSGPYVIPNAFGRGDYVMHPGISPQPYMGPAFDGQVENVVDGLSHVALLAIA